MLRLANSLRGKLPVVENDGMVSVRCRACRRPVQTRLCRLTRVIGCSKCGAGFSVDAERLRQELAAGEQKFSAAWDADRANGGGSPKVE